MKIREAKISYKTVGEIGSDLLDSSEADAEYMAGAFDDRPFQEAIWVIGLNRKNRPLGRHLLAIGSDGAALLPLKYMYKTLLLMDASAFILVHNHPSGDPTPSRDDFYLTQKIIRSAQILTFDFLDHIIIGDKSLDPAGAGWSSWSAEPQKWNDAVKPVEPAAPGNSRRVASRQVVPFSS